MFEDTYKGFEIYIEENDVEGFDISICKDGEELETSIEFDLDVATEKSYEIINGMVA